MPAIAVLVGLLTGLTGARGEGPVEPRGTLVFTEGGTTAQMRDPQLDADQWAVLTTPEPIRDGFTDQGIDTALVFTDHYVYIYDPSRDPRDRWVGAGAPNNEIVEFAQLANRVPRGLESRGPDPNDPAFRIYGGFRTQHYVFLYDPTLDPRDRWVRIDTPRPTVSLVMTGQTAVITTESQVLFYDPQLSVNSRVSGFDLAPGESSTVAVTVDARSGTLVTVTTDRQVVLYDASLDPNSRILGTTLGPNETVDTSMSRVAGNTGAVVTDQRVIVFDGALDPRSRALTMPLGPNETVTMVDVSGQVAVFVTDGNRAVFYDRTLDPSNRFAATDVGGTVQQVIVNENGNAAAVLSDRGLTVYDGTLDPASRVLQSPLEPGETAVAIRQAGDSFVMVTSGRAVVFDPTRDPRDAFVDVPLPPGEFVAAGGARSGTAVATTGGVVVYDPGANVWHSQEFRDGVTNVFVAQNMVLVTTNTGAVVYDGTRDPRDRWLPVPLGAVNGALAGRDTAMVFNGEQVAFWDSRDSSWSTLPPPANETWRNGLINYRIGIVCSEKGAAVWDPGLDPRNAWQMLNPGGGLRVNAIMRDGNSFAVIAENKVFVYNRGRHEWVEREAGAGTTARGGRGEPVKCDEHEPPETGEVEEPEEPEVIDESTEPEPPGPIATPDPGSTVTPDGDGDIEPGTSVIIIIDASGSMADYGKIDQAKSAARNMLTSGLPAGHEVGLVIFYDCGAIEWTPFTTNYASLLPVVDGIAPSGSTPIAASIGVAADKMRTEGRGSEGRIILLTDGGENCAGDPVDAATSAHQVEVGSGRPGGALPPAGGPAYVSADPVPPRGGGLLPAGPAAQGGNVRLDVIGFQLDETTTQSMQQVAQAGGGVYVPAQNAAELNKAFETLAATVTSGSEGDPTKSWAVFAGGAAAFVILAMAFIQFGLRPPSPARAAVTAAPAEPVEGIPPGAGVAAVSPEAAPPEALAAEPPIEAPPVGASSAAEMPPSPIVEAPPAEPAVAAEPILPAVEEAAIPAAAELPPIAEAGLPPEVVSEVEAGAVPQAPTTAETVAPPLEARPTPVEAIAPATPPPAGQPAPVGMLLALAGRTSSLSVALEQRATNIGSDPRGDIAFDEPGVAALHAQIRREGDLYVVYAIGQAAVLCNGQDVRRAVLKDGDVLDLGPAKLVFRRQPVAPPSGEGAS